LDWWRDGGDRNFSNADGGGAAAFVDVHEFAYERDGVEPYAVGEESHESTSVDGSGDSVEIFTFHFLDDLDEHVRLRRHLRTGEAFGLAGGSQCFSK
jgi:hypothetical protein